VFGFAVNSAMSETVDDVRYGDRFLRLLRNDVVARRELAVDERRERAEATTPGDRVSARAAIARCGSRGRGERLSVGETSR
jgi:hypothetical protein